MSYIYDLHTLPQGRFDWKLTFCLTQFLYLSHQRGDIRVNHMFSLRGRILILMPSLNKIKAMTTMMPPHRLAGKYKKLIG